MDNFYEYLKNNRHERIPQLLGIHSEGVFYNFELLTFHFNECPQFYSGTLREHRHNVFHIVFYGEDNQPNKFVLNGEKIATGPGLVVLIPPGMPHSFAPLEKHENYSYHEITFSLSNLSGGCVFQGDFAELFGKYWGCEFNEVPCLLQFNKRDILIAEHHYRKIVQRLESLVNNELGPVYVNISEFLFFIIEKSCAVNLPMRDEKLAPFVLKACEYIEKNYIRNPSLRTIASASGISPEHLCRCFKDYYGVTPVHYGLKLRLSAAEQLLSSSNLTIGEISSRLGFSDIYTFSKAFKRELGVPPGAFRRTAQ